MEIKLDTSQIKDTPIAMVTTIWFSLCFEFLSSRLVQKSADDAPPEPGGYRSKDRNPRPQL